MILFAALWWVAIFGVWPLADPGHDDFSNPLVVLDLTLHVVAFALLMNGLIDHRVERRMRCTQEHGPKRVTTEGDCPRCGATLDVTVTMPKLGCCVATARKVRR